MRRLPETVQVLYAELLDQLRAADTDLHLPIGGSFVSKTIGGGRYWYLQRDEKGHRTQTYLGAETPELLQQISAAKEQQADRKRRRQLVAMLTAGGAASESASFTAVLEVLADSFVFRLGGVLVGTQAFMCYANMLGVRFDAESLRTADIDIAESAGISVAVAQEGSLDLLERLKSIEPRFGAVPELDPRDPSTSLKVRGRDLRIDFLTTTRRGTRKKPVPLPHLKVAAQPLEGLDYLIEKTTKAAVVGGSGILVNVPLPGRYALHKLWVAKNRPVSDQTKARKDISQAQQVIEVLLIDRPDDIDEAVTAMRSRPKLWSHVRTELDRITSASEGTRSQK
ncbi:MAG TPA: GSU2403 family nucleotidyltransferase fold protein [Thermoanaerobaculia bacterium]|nr:GSU2403 family nucleotidyltransferase fold protein [Thermoanaerobaculia bacterium]